MKKSIFFFLILFIISCKKGQLNLDNFSKFNNDTIFSKGNQIIFFKPSDEFYDNELINFEGIQEVDSDFNFYANKVCNDLNKKLNLPIKAIITESRFIGVIGFKKDTTFIDRYKDSLHYGTLMNFKEKKYKIDEGIFTDIDFWKNFPKLDIDKSTIKFPEKVNVILNNNSKTDTIIDIETFDYWLDFKLNYKELKRKILNNKIKFSNNNYELIVEISNFDKSKYVLSNNQELGITINGQRFEGADDDFYPKEIISDIVLKYHNEYIKLDKFIFENLGAPNIKSAISYQLNEDFIALEMHNGDGAYAYSVYIFISKTGKTKKIIVYS